jgi:hypothetical protein
MARGRMKPETPAFNKQEFIALLMRLAWTPPEQTRGSLEEQIRACKLMASFGYEPAFKRLNEIATTDPVRTNGRRRDQDAAAKVLTRLLNKSNIDNIRIQ